MSKENDTKACAHESASAKHFSSKQTSENHEQSYSSVQTDNSQDFLWERKKSSAISSKSLNELKSVLHSQDVLTDCKEALISELALKKQSSLVQLFGKNVPNSFASFCESTNEMFFTQSQDLLIKNDLPSLIVHDNYLKKHATHIQSSDHIPNDDNGTQKKIESSKSFHCMSQSFSNSQVIQSSNESSESSCFKKSGFASAISRFQETTIQTQNQTYSEPSLLSKISDSSSIVSRNRQSFEYFRHANIYKYNSERVMSACLQNFDNVSESDDEEDEDGNEIAYAQREAIEYPTTENTNSGDNGPLLMIEFDTKKDKNQQTLLKIATELLTTERTYVGILYLLDQVFAFRVDQENRAHAMFSQETVAHMFTNLKSLYKLHHDFLLPQLEGRMSHWEEKPCIGDIMKNFAPFLKMYAEYVKNYDNAVKLINMWAQKHNRFTQILEELHALDECKQITLQHHMLTPVQRVPRYQLLLKDYLKKLPEDSPDKCDTEKALELVSIAANHANDTMKKIDKFKKLLEIQEMISGCVDLVSPSRELLKEGKIIKISARSGDHQERYIFLFSDLLLLCSHRLLPNKVVSGPCFRVRAQLDVDNLVVEEGDNLETANTFYIHTFGRLIELYTPTRGEKLHWMEVLSRAVNVLAEKKRSLKVGNGDSEVEDCMELGTRAPNFVKLESITHCMACDSLFSTFTFRRKHHCHACGIVACNKCLVHKIQLPYEGGKQAKVCKGCYEILVKDPIKQEQSDDRQRNIDSPQRQKGILDVNPNDPSIVSGYLQLKARSRFWVKRWFALHDDFVLYSFNSHIDEMALTSMPLPGYTIGIPDKTDNVDGRENVFKLFHKKKMYFFQTSDQSELQRWVSALDKASKAESFS